jgi:cell division protein FtsB
MMLRRHRMLLAAMLMGAGTLVVHTFVAADGWSLRTRAQRDLDTLESDITAAERRVTELRLQIEGLRGRRAVQEHVVRDELGYVRPGDVVVDVGATTAGR